MVDRTEHPNREQSEGHLKGRLRQCGCDCGYSNAEKKHQHHAFTAPLISQPAGGQRKETERDKTGGRVWNQLSVRHTPLPGQSQRCCRSENQHQKMIDEMTQIKENKMSLLVSFQGRSPALPFVNFGRAP